jgi:hypothetical protein
MRHIQIAEDAHVPFKHEDALIVLSISGQGVQGDIDAAHLVVVTLDKKIFVRDLEGEWEEATKMDVKELFEYTQLVRSLGSFMGW